MKLATTAMAGRVTISQTIGSFHQGRGSVGSSAFMSLPYFRKLDLASRAIRAFSSACESLTGAVEGWFQVATRDRGRP